MPRWKYLLYLVSSTPFKPPKPFINPISPQSDDFFPHPIAPFHLHSKPTRPANLASISKSHFLFLPFPSPFHTHYFLLPFPTFFSISSNPTKSNPISPLFPLSFHPLTAPYTHHLNLSQSNPSITLKVSSPTPHLHHAQPNPPFQPQINALPPWFPRLPPFVNSQLRTANPGVITLLDEFLF